MHWLNSLAAEGEHATRLRNDFPYFAGNLVIRPKEGALVPFKLNAAQLKLHEALEEQKRRTGRVRAIVLKARQLGISTYVAARFYHRTISNPGLRTIIIGHERSASKNLFSMVKRFHENLPPDLRPSTGISNADELVFDKIDSGYLVAVATLEGAGRSATAQLLHCSEVAFWPDLPIQMAALMQTVPDLPGTEVILESTAFGFNDFHKLWRKSEAGENEFQTIFLPWTADPNYRADVPGDIKLDPEELDLMEMHGLDREQIFWRRNKIAQLPNPETFPQEYPLVASEAFIASSFDSFIPADLVLRARKENIEPHGRLIVGVDPASTGPDRTSIAFRQGHCITKVESKRGLDTMETCGWINQIIREQKPVQVNLDVGGLGVGIYDRLIEQGHDRFTINAVNFGGKPVEPPPTDETGKPGGGYANRRAELYGNLRAALQGRFSLPDSDSLQADLVSVGYKYTSEGKLLLESKQDMRRRGVPSPDEADAVALCFTAPLGSPYPRGARLPLITLPGEAYV